MEYLPIQHHIDICEHGTDCEVCCWPWTAGRARSGYGRTKAECYGRIETYAHRIMWAYYHETSIPMQKIVNHSCGNKLCCNPTHLELMTYTQHRMKIRKERQGPKANGKRWGYVKLTEKQVLQVLAMGKSRKKTQQQIANELGVSQVNIGYILRGRTWKHLQPANRNGAAKD